jgi:hypothetical protein
MLSHGCVLTRTHLVFNRPCYTICNNVLSLGLVEPLIRRIDSDKCARKLLLKKVSRFLENHCLEAHSDLFDEHICIVGNDVIIAVVQCGVVRNLVKIGLDFL